MKLSRRFFLSLIAAAAWSASPAFGQTDAETPLTPPWPILEPSEKPAPLPGTQLLSLEGDLASQMVAGADAFLLEQIAHSIDHRAALWQRDFALPYTYSASVEPNRQRLRDRLGLRDARATDAPGLRYLSSSPALQPLIEGKHFKAYSVRWPVLDGISGVGILLTPKDENDIVADIVAIPDADQTPEEIAGIFFPEPRNSFSLTIGETASTKTMPFALKLAHSGCRVLIPMLINRDEHPYKMSNREWLHRSAYELGRSLAGYELQKVLSGIDSLQGVSGGDRPLGVIGWGEGGRLALYAGALDERIDATCVGGYFGDRRTVWNEPADRTVFGLLSEFGDAEIASLIAPRALTVEAGPAPAYVFRPAEDGDPEMIETGASKNGKPGKLIEPTLAETRAEVERAVQLVAELKPKPPIALVENDDNLALTDPTLQVFLQLLSGKLNDAFALVNHHEEVTAVTLEDPDRRHADQLAEIERHNQRVLQNSYQERIDYMAELKTDSLEAFEGSVEAFREKFRRDVVGAFDVERLPLNPRSRPYQEGPLTVSYEVVLDTFPGVFAYGVLTLPKDLKLDGSEKRPVVVCQHGLEGRPQDVISESKYKAYKAFATRLAERGFITFAPQNPYIFHDRFRTLQFKAAAVGCTLFSVIVPQHQQITDWLQTQPYVAADRIAFYGLSYGGKSAMRIPPLVSDYCLSICSADFNEWVWKNAATDKRSLRYSYANKREYEIFEFGLGRTFNYAEMASLICPRPFMVERGHFDGVGPDDRVAQEFAKVRFLYQAKLGIGDRVEIEWFAGPHSINADGTYDFLHRHLDWPAPEN